MEKLTESRRSELRHNLSLLRTLRDEIRLDLHLAGMEAHEEWTRLEPCIAEVR